MSGKSFIRGASESAGFKTKIYLILIIFMLSGRFSLYIISPKTLKILKGPNLVKFNLLLSYIVWMNIILIFDIFCRRYTLFPSLRVGP